MNSNVSSNSTCWFECANEFVGHDNNTLYGLDPDDENVLKNPFIRLVIFVTYFFIFSVGLTGNSLIVYIIVRTRNMHTITNMFITNLAISDIVMCLLSVPFTPIALFMDAWVFGEVVCHIIPMTMAISVYVSTLTSTAISVDRYFVIVHPFLPRMRKWLCLLIILTIWSVSTAISLPLAMYQKVSQQPGAPNGTMDCIETWPKNNTRKIFTLSSFVLQFCIPGMIIGFCYARVNFVLKRRLISKISRAVNAKRSKDIADIRRKRRTNRMLIVMICAFCTAWSGLNALHIAVEFAESLNAAKYFVLFFLLTHATAMSSTNYNPFLYGLMNETFRNEMRHVLGFRLWSLVTCIYCRTEMALGSHLVTMVTQPHSHNPDNEHGGVMRMCSNRRSTKEPPEAHGALEQPLKEPRDRIRSQDSQPDDDDDADVDNGDGDTFLEEHSSDDSVTRRNKRSKRKEYHALPALLFGNGLMHAMTIGIAPQEENNKKKNRSLSAKFEQMRKLSVPFSAENSTSSSAGLSPSNIGRSSKSHSPVGAMRSCDHRHKPSQLALKGTKSNGFVPRKNPDEERNWANPTGKNDLMPIDSFAIEREAVSEQISPIPKQDISADFRSFAFGSGEA